MLTTSCADCTTAVPHVAPRTIRVRPELQETCDTACRKCCLANERASLRASVAVGPSRLHHQ